jgi:hypothetical protein
MQGSDRVDSQARNTNRQVGCRLSPPSFRPKPLVDPLILPIPPSFPPFTSHDVWKGRLAHDLVDQYITLFPPVSEPTTTRLHTYF